MLITPFVRPIRRTAPPFTAQAGSRAVCPEIGRISHDRLAIWNLGRGQIFHNPQEDALFASALSTVAERPGEVKFLRRPNLERFRV